MSEALRSTKEPEYATKGDIGRLEEKVDTTLENVISLTVTKEQTLEELRLMKDSIKQVHSDMKYLEELPRISQKLDQNFQSLVTALTGKSSVPESIFKMVNRIYMVIIAGLIFTIVFILTGQKLGVFNLTH